MTRSPQPSPPRPSIRPRNSGSRRPAVAFRLLILAAALAITTTPVLPVMPVMPVMPVAMAEARSATPYRGPHADLLPPAVAASGLDVLQTRHYLIATDLKRQEALYFARYMDFMFGEYEKRFARAGHAARSGDHDDEPTVLYLISTKKRYQEFLRHFGINAGGSTGMFFVRPEIRGLAAYTHGRPVSATIRTLMHEGFHQFAWSHIGHRLPIWVNEGIAQYFEDGIIVDRRLMLDFNNSRRIATVKHAIEKDTLVDFRTMLEMSSEQWIERLNHDSARASVMYAQAWSMTFFLINGDEGRYRTAFNRYLHLIAAGGDADEAFVEAFGTRNVDAFERRWRDFARDHEPGPVHTTLDRMQFLGVALRYLHEQGQAPPKTIHELRQRLERMRFYATFTREGVEVSYKSSDPELYQFPIARGRSRVFQILESESRSLPPRVRAAGLRPQPELFWYRDQQGELVQDVKWR